MNILLTTSWQAPEYLYDAVLHGLRSLFGTTVVDYPQRWFMYNNILDKKLSTIVGKGFSLYGLLADENIDRTHIAAKIRRNFFDYIVMMPWYPSPLAHLIYQYTPSQKIIWLDGRDESYILEPYVGWGKYFKRELITNRSNVLPISFAIPKEKIQQPIEKTRVIAHCIPGQLDTYIYDNEQDYYNGYNESLFGITRKKQGWDCMRHYEILASRSVPWFIDLAQCPESICTTLPKDLLLDANKMLEQYEDETIFLSPVRDQYEELRSKIHDHFVKTCTTEALARYVLNIS